MGQQLEDFQMGGSCQFKKICVNDQRGEGGGSMIRDKGIKICLSVRVLICSDLRSVLIVSIIIFIFPTYKLCRSFASLLFLLDVQMFSYFLAFICKESLILGTFLVCISYSFTLPLFLRNLDCLRSRLLISFLSSVNDYFF